MWKLPPGTLIACIGMMVQTNNKQKTILLVEDETPILSTLTFILNRAGYTVYSSQDGIDALARLEKLIYGQKTIDLLITDIQMNGMNGMQLIDKVKALQPVIPILVITGYGNKEIVVELLRKGCMEYIDKPFKPDLFLKRVKEVLEKEELRISRLENDRAELQRNFENYKLKSDKLSGASLSATRIFNSLLDYKPAEFDIPCTYRSLPREYTGGDLFLIRKTTNGCDILAADVAGHDMGASFYAVLIKGLFEDPGQETGDGVRFFDMLNAYLLKNINEKILVTAVFLGLNLKQMQGEVVSAGHCSPILMYKGEYSAFQHAGNVIGVLDKVEFKKQPVKLFPGQRFILFTDGVINATRYTEYDRKEKKLLQDGLLAMLKKWNYLPLNELVDHVFTDILFYCDKKPADDMLLVGMEIPVPGHKGGVNGRC